MVKHLERLIRETIKNKDRIHYITTLKNNNNQITNFCMQNFTSIQSESSPHDRVSFTFDKNPANRCRSTPSVTIDSVATINSSKIPSILSS